MQVFDDVKSGQAFKSLDTALDTTENALRAVGEKELVDESIQMKCVPSADFL